MAEPNADPEAVRQARFASAMRFLDDFQKNLIRQNLLVEKQIEAVGQLVGAVGQLTEANAAVFEAITSKDGAIHAIDDLLAEVQDLRSDLQNFAKVCGIKVAFGSILGGERKRR